MSPAERERVTYLNVPDPSQPFGYNPVRRVRDDLIPLAASGLIETFRKLWPLAWGVRMEHVLRNSVYALLEREGSTLPDLLRMSADKSYRKSVVRGIRNGVVRTYWTSEFENYPPRLQAEAVGPIQNKLGALLADPTLYRVLVEPAVDIRFRSLMDDGRVLLVNLAKGRLGEDAIVDYLPFTAIQNATGQPAIALPLHWNDAGLPIGIQFVAPTGDEATLIGLSAQIEAAAPWEPRCRAMRHGL